MTTGLGTDSRWVVTDGVGDIDEEWSDEDDEGAAFGQALFRRITCSRLWYAPTYGIDCRGYLLDTATDAQIQIELGAQIDADERTARSEITVERFSQRRATVSIKAWDQRGRVHALTLPIGDLTAEIVLGNG